MSRLLPALLLSACMPDTDDPTNVALVTDEGRYVVLLAPDPDPPVTGAAALDLDVTADETGAEDLVITVEPWMPSMGHGVSTAPSVEEAGDGAYRSEWEYPMPGAWEVKLTLEGSAGSDTLTVAYDVQ